MKIKKIEIYSTYEKYRRPIPIAVGVHDTRADILVKIIAKHNNNLFYGWGEGSPLLPSYSGETQQQMVDDVIKRIAPDILEKEINEVSDILMVMGNIDRNKYYFMCAQAAVDLALFDLLGQLKKQPVFNLLRRELGLPLWDLKNLPQLPANFAVSRVATNKSDGIKEMIKEADYYFNQGYQTIKIKIGVYKNSDEKSVRELSQFIKDKYPRKAIYLFADANQGYQTQKEAMSVILKIKSYIFCLEQPFHRDLPILSARLNQKLKKIPQAPMLITDEGNASIYETENIIMSEAADGALLKLVRSGGFNYVIKLAKLLKKYPWFKLGPCSMTETGIGTIANLHSALIVHDYCEPRLGFGFDGPLQVIGENYKNGKDTIIYANKKTGLFCLNKKGICCYNPSVIIGNGSGFGFTINPEYIRQITREKTSIYLRDEKVIVEKKKYDQGKIVKIVKENLGNLKEILKHPRY